MAQQGAALQNYNNELVKCKQKNSVFSGAKINLIKTFNQTNRHRRPMYEAR